MKKNLGILFLFFGVCQLFASIDERLETLQGKMEEVTMQTREGDYGAHFQTADPDVKGKDWFATFDILYWHPKVGGTEYAATKNGAVTTYPQIGRVKDHDFKWDWGFRAGLGGLLPHDQWDLCANFTFYENDDTSSTHKRAPATAYALKGFFGGNFSRAKTSFEIMYLNLDLELGRRYFMSRYLAFRPHLGVKAARIRLQQRARYNFSPLEPGGLAGEYYHVKNRSDSDGIGPRVGAQGTWFIGYGFRLFSDVSAALLYNRDEVRMKEKASQGASSYNVNIRLSGDGHHFTPFFQMFSGLSWGSYLNEEKFFLLFKLGYEVQYYFRQNQAFQAEDFGFGNNNPPSTRLAYERQGEDLSFYGITFSARMDF